MELEAEAVTATEPETVVPATGAVSATTGGAAALLTVTATPELVVLSPAVSVATAERVCEPLAAEVVFQAVA